MNKEIDSNFFLSFPTNKFAGDISPYKIFVVILLKEYLRKQPIQHKDNDGGLNPDEKPEFPALNYDPDYRRKISMLLLKLTQISDMSYKDLHRLLVDGKYKVEEGHLKAFEESICTLSQRGIEVLFKLSKIMDELITETQTKNNSPMIHQSSCIGLFFRRILVHLEKMSFQELMSLHANINTYYETGMRELGLPYETTTKSCDTKEPNKPKWSSKQAEIFIAQQSALLENDEVKSLNPKELQNKIDEIVHTYTPLSSRAYFLSYLNNVRIRDFPNCLEALHRSFDKNVGKPALDNPETTSNKTQFQYSLLNLAILHTIFEHNGEALKCLKECIMIAQETGDRVCLQLAQLWLCLLDKKNFQLSEKNIANKTEKTLVRSVSLNIQSLVKVAAISGYLPSKLFDVLVKSDILNCQHSIMNLIANCIAERAALWNLYGKHEMASLITQQLLNSNLKVMEKTHNGEGLCLALCSQTLWLSLQGEAAAVDVLLSRIKQRFQRYPISKNWMLVEYYTQSTRAIHHEKWSDGFEACDNLYSIDKNLSILQRAALNLARGNRSTALCLLDLLLEDDNIDSLCMIRVMTMQAMCMTEPGNIFSESLLILNRAAVLARDKYLDYEYSIVNMHISYILLHMNMAEEALRIIKLNIENILSNGGVYDKGKALFLFSQCVIAAAITKDEKIMTLRKVLEQLELAVKYFTKLENWQKVKSVYVYLAKLYNELGMHDERNHNAYKFRLIVEEHTTSYNDNLNLFY